MNALSDEIESVLFICREVMGESRDLRRGSPGPSLPRNAEQEWRWADGIVYQVPPRTSSSGYKAADWNVESFVWKGRLRVMEVGDRCELRLEVSRHLFPSLSAAAGSRADRIGRLNRRAICAGQLCLTLDTSRACLGQLPVLCTPRRRGGREARISWDGVPRTG